MNEKITPPNAMGNDDLREGLPPQAMDTLWDLELPVSIRLGRTSMQLAEACQLDAGSLVDLDRGVDDPVEILVNDRLIATARLVVIDGRYAVTVLALAEPAGRSGGHRVDVFDPNPAVLGEPRVQAPPL
jgi:flagellar motor switch protein FliN